MTEPDSAAEPTARPSVLLGVLAGAVVIRLWVLPLGSSLWLDECGTAWVTAGRFGEILERARLFPQSLPYAAIVWGMRALFGSSEIVLRLPSLLAMLAAAWCLFRLGRALVDRETGLLAAGIFLLFPEIEFAAGDARPYALGVLAAIGALWALVRWLDRGRAGDAVVYVLLAGATVYFHYLFATMLVAHAVYALRRRRHGSPVSGRQLVAAAVGLGLVLAPAAALALEMGRRRAAHGFAGSPRLGALAQVLVPGRVLGPLFAALIVSWLLRVATGFRKPRPAREPTGDTLVLLVLAALLPAPLLFAISRAAGTHMFVQRYLMAAIPAQAILLAWLLGTVLPARGRRVVLGCSLAFVLLQRGGVHDIEIAHGRENWRDAVSALNAVNGAGPVFLGGSFVEARSLEIVKDPAHAAYLRAPLDVYPARGPVFVLPLGAGAAGEAYVAGILAESPPESVALIERSSSFPSWQPWFEERFRAQGYAMKEVWASGPLTARVFRRARARETP